MKYQCFMVTFPSNLIGDKIWIWSIWPLNPEIRLRQSGKDVMLKVRTGKCGLLPRYQCKASNSVLASFLTLHTQGRSWWHGGLDRQSQKTQRIAVIHKKTWIWLRKAYIVYPHNWSSMPKRVNMGEAMTEKPVYQVCHNFHQKWNF